MTDIRIMERLCLSREDDIYVDHCQLPQHQIDGIRFLYAQFKKKKPGVILNDPSGYGKTLQVVLFLYAVRRLLPAPVLILVREGELPLWREHFRRWTQFEDDVVFESTNPFAKKAVFVSTRHHATPLVRRAWAVVVADDDCARDRPQADFKICLSHLDMKENLYTFSSVYQWFYPKEVLDIKEFAANKNDPKDVVSKSIMLDTFLEDIVIRRKNFTPFRKPETLTSLAIEPPRVSRKNKDATGTKIKRSKARIDAETSQAPKLPRIDPPERNATITSKDYYKNREMDVESFIKNEKPIESDGVEELMDFQTMMTKSDSNDYKPVHDVAKQENGSIKVNGDKVNVTIKDDESECVNESEVNTADFQDAINDIISNENDRDKTNDSGINESDGDIQNSISNMEDDGDRSEDIETSKTDGDSVNEISTCDEKELVFEETKETIQDVVNNGSKQDLESKITELEEATLKKFKGSLLDSIF